MAINRNIIRWSDKEIAFESLTYTEIFNMLLENYRAIYGAEIDLSVETAFGEELRMTAELLHDFAELAQHVYYTLDVNNAKGAILDNLVSFTSNMVRRENTRTRLRGEMTFGAGEEKIDKNAIVYIQDLNGLSWKVTHAESNDLESNKPYDIELESVAFGENYFGTAVLVTVGNSFFTGDVTIKSLIYDQIGTIEETDEILRARKNDILSHNSLGVLDSIRDHILKNIFSVKDVKIYNANGSSTDSSTLDSKGNTVLELRIDSNGVSEVVNIGINKHDVFVIIQPQTGLKVDAFRKNEKNTATSLAVAEAIKQKLTPGISTSDKLYKIHSEGENEGDLDINNNYDQKDNYIKEEIDVSGVDASEEYRFYVANPYQPPIQISIQDRNNNDRTASGERIRKAVCELSKTYVINQDIDISEILTAVMKTNLDISNPSYIPTGITVIGGMEVKNGYWSVDDQLAEGQLVSDQGAYGITITWSGDGS